MKKLGFLFGAGAEISYGMPSGGKFALDIFRHSTQDSKNTLRDMRSKIDTSSAYATNWLPEDFESKSISSFGQRVFDSIIKSTTGMTPNEWINDVVVNNAKHLLHKSENTIKEVSYALNFPNPSFFCKFKINCKILA